MGSQTGEKPGLTGPPLGSWVAVGKMIHMPKLVF